MIDAYPAPDRLATIESVSLSTGGAALNLAVDLRLLGATFPIGLSGAVGGDEHGRFILAECARLDIDSSEVVEHPGSATSFTDAMVERIGGRRTFFHHHGANALFEATNVKLATSRARIMHAGAPGLHELLDAGVEDGGNGWSRLFERGQAAGLHTNMELVSMEPSIVASLATPCLPHLDSIIVNELEAGALTGIEVAAPDVDGPVDWAAMEAMATGLIERGVSKIAVVHFPAGCVAAAPGGRSWRQGSSRWPASRSPIPPAPAMRSLRESCSACTMDGRSRHACVSVSHRRPRACAARARRGASISQRPAWLRRIARGHGRPGPTDSAGRRSVYPASTSNHRTTESTKAMPSWLAAGRGSTNPGR